MPKIILCHCTCVIVINVDTCNEHDTTLNHTKSMHVFHFGGSMEKSWGEYSINGSILSLSYARWALCPHMTVNSHKVTMNYCLNEVLFHIYMVYFVLKF